MKVKTGRMFSQVRPLTARNQTVPSTRLQDARATSAAAQAPRSAGRGQARPHGTGTGRAQAAGTTLASSAGGKDASATGPPRLQAGSAGRPEWPPPVGGAIVGRATLQPRVPRGAPAAGRDGPACLQALLCSLPSLVCSLQPSCAPSSLCAPSSPTCSLQPHVLPAAPSSTPSSLLVLPPASSCSLQPPCV